VVTKVKGGFTTGGHGGFLWRQVLILVERRESARDDGDAKLTSITVIIITITSILFLIWRIGAWVPDGDPKL
jgi:hypothetical protein